MMRIIAYMRGSFAATFPARASEWALALALLNCGMIMTLNRELFAENPESYRALAHLASQHTWAVACLMGGMFRFCMLGVNGMWRRSPHLRALGAFVACLFWFLISYGLLQTASFGLVTAIVPVLLLLDSYNAVRALGEGAVVDTYYASKKSSDARVTPSVAV